MNSFNCSRQVASVLARACCSSAAICMRAAEDANSSRNLFPQSRAVESAWRAHTIGQQASEQANGRATTMATTMLQTSLLHGPNHCVPPPSNSSAGTLHAPSAVRVAPTDGFLVAQLHTRMSKFIAQVVRASQPASQPEAPPNLEREI